MGLGDDELDGTVFEALNLEVEEVFLGGVACFVVAWSDPILNLYIYTV